MGRGKVGERNPKKLRPPRVSSGTEKPPRDCDAAHVMSPVHPGIGVRGSLILLIDHVSTGGRRYCALRSMEHIPCPEMKLSARIILYYQLLPLFVDLSCSV